MEVMQSQEKNIKPQKKRAIKNCEVCGEVVLFINEYGNEHAVDCSCSLKREVSIKISRFEKLSRYMGNYSNDTFQSYKARTKTEIKIKNKYMKYCKNFEKFKKIGIGILFYGSAGSGKTFLANCIANEVKKAGYPVLYFQLDNYIKEIKDGWDEKEEQILRVIKDVGLIVIDDWGILKELKDWRYNKIYNLINTITLEKIPLIITTNNALDELDTDDNKRISDRLSAICKGELMDFPSRRQRTAEKAFDLVMSELE